MMRTGMNTGALGFKRISGTYKDFKTQTTKPINEDVDLLYLRKEDNKVTINNFSGSKAEAVPNTIVFNNIDGNSNLSLDGFDSRKGDKIIIENIGNPGETEESKLPHVIAHRGGQVQVNNANGAIFLLTEGYFDIKKSKNIKVQPLHEY